MNNSSAPQKNSQNKSPDKESVELSDIDIPVSIDPALSEALAPNSFLASLGISLEKREAHIKQLAQAMIKPKGISDNLQSQIPFMVTKGPFIREELLMVNASPKDQNGITVIALSLAEER
jgi:hypothetical protein